MCKMSSVSSMADTGVSSGLEVTANLLLNTQAMGFLYSPVIQQGWRPPAEWGGWRCALISRGESSHSHEGWWGAEGMLTTLPKITGHSWSPGNIRNTEKLSYDKQRQYEILVTAYDCGQKPAAQDTLVQVDVKPVCKPGWQGGPGFHSSMREGS